MTISRRAGALVTASVAAALVAGCSAGGETEPAADPSVVRIGLLSTLSGPFAPLGEAANRGAKLALIEAGGTLVGSGPLDIVRGAKVGGKPVQLSIESSDDASPDTAVNAARRLVEQRHVDVVVGPMSGDEGLAVKNYISTMPGVTLVNGAAAAQNMTLRDPAPNVFRFSTDGAQWMAGLGEYAGERYDRIATVAADHSYLYDEVGGFLTEFCTPGHSVSKRVWIPAGTQDYAAYLKQIPADVDAVFVALAGTETLDFVRQLDEFTGGRDLPIVAGSLAMDPAIAAELGDRIEGTITAGPVAERPEDPAYKAYAEALREYFPDSGPPGFADVLYYVAMKATLTALEQSDGVVSDHQKSFRRALAGLTLDTPQGPVRLDANRHAIANNYLFRVTDGRLTLLRAVPDVTQSLGRASDAYAAEAAFDRSNPVCGAQRPAVTR